MMSLRRASQGRACAALLACSALLSGCIAPDAPPAYRFLDPLPAPPQPIKAASVPKAGAMRPVRLRRVAARAHLETKLVSRATAAEVRFAETTRWVEEPARLVEQALADALYAGLGVPMAAGADGCAVDVLVVAFEEVVRPDGRVAAVALVVAVESPSRTVLLRERLGAETPVRSDDPAALAAAMREALSGAARKAAAAISAATAAEK